MRRLDRITLPHLDSPVARLALGTAWFDAKRFDEMTALLEAFVELGGNLIDTAENYGDAESVIGRWLAESARRADVVIATKGGHPYDGRSRLTRPDIERDLFGSLERLRLDRVDAYALHRDDPSTPVGSVLEILNRLLEGGFFSTFGASNWSTARLDAADAYAREHGLRGFSFSSPNLSLARWSSPPWDGVVSASESASRQWYEQRQLPLVAWSPQAAGFFALRDVDRLDADERRVIGVYDTPDNRERRRRAAAVGRERGYAASEIALAWVLDQPFPTIAVAGGRTPDELRSNALALDIGLDAAARDWLDLAGDAPE